MLKRDPRAARAGEHDLLQNPNLFLHVVCIRSLSADAIIAMMN
jgi:hypothetical protein